MLLALCINGCEPGSKGITRFFASDVLTGLLEKRAAALGEFVAPLKQATAATVQHIASRLRLLQLCPQRLKLCGISGNLRIELKPLALTIKLLVFVTQVELSLVDLFRLMLEAFGQSHGGSNQRFNILFNYTTLLLTLSQLFEQSFGLFKSLFADLESVQT